MSYEIKGERAVVAELERRLGKARMQQVTDVGLRRGAEVFVDELKRQYNSRRDKGYSQGYTVKEITVSEPVWDGDNRIIKVHWQGPHGRYRLVHLNEWGTVTNPNPPWKGVIASAMRNAEKAYHEAMMQALKEGL